MKETCKNCGKRVEVSATGSRFCFGCDFHEPTQPAPVQNPTQVKPSEKRSPGTGESIIAWSRIFLGIEIVLCVIIAVVLFVGSLQPGSGVLAWAGVAVLVIGPMISYFFYLLLKGFGELVRNSSVIKQKMCDESCK